jgi:rhomboid protease GluP
MLSPRLRWKLDRLREQLAAGWRELFRSEPKPRLCFNCGALVGASETLCSACGASQSALSLSAFRRVALAAIPAESPVSYFLLFSNFLLFAVAWVASQKAADTATFAVGGHVMYLLGAKWAPAIALGEYWRLVMASFLHWDLFHIGFNSLALWQLGPPLEDTYGSRRFLFLYLLTGVAGFAASCWWRPDALSAGASASIFGLLGVQFSLLGRQGLFARQNRSQLLRSVGFMLVLGLFLPLDNAAHLGGFACGILLGRVVSDRRPATRRAQLAVNLMGLGSAAAILWSAAMVLLHLPRPGS